MSINGILNTFKPPGKTSFQAVQSVRRMSGERRVGHTGTLDPDATGVLPICLGRATRLVQFLEGDKGYRAEIELGITTDSYDSSGRVTKRVDPSSITTEDLEASLSCFRGIIEQTPPMYSAVRYEGRHLYELARAGIEVERGKRRAQIYRLEVKDFSPPVVTIEVDCSKGTYIRSLAHDLGQRLGCGSHLRSLVRLWCGSFYIEDALTIPQLEDAFRYGFWQDIIYPLDAVLAYLMAVIVDEGNERSILNGRPIPLGHENDEGQLLRAYSKDGRFLALIRSRAGLWQPERVFSIGEKLDI